MIEKLPSGLFSSEYAAVRGLTGQTTGPRSASQFIETFQNEYGSGSALAKKLLQTFGLLLPAIAFGSAGALLAGKLVAPLGKGLQIFSITAGDELCSALVTGGWRVYGNERESYKAGASKDFLSGMLTRGVLLGAMTLLPGGALMSAIGLPLLMTAGSFLAELIVEEDRAVSDLFSKGAEYEWGYRALSSLFMVHVQSRLLRKLPTIVPSFQMKAAVMAGALVFAPTKMVATVGRGNGAVVRGHVAKKRTTMTAKQAEVFNLKRRGYTFVEIGEQLGVDRKGVASRFEKALKHVPPAVAKRIRKKRMTRGEGEVVRLRLRGHSQEQIGNVLKIAPNTVWYRLKTAKKFLHPKTIQRLSKTDSRFLNHVTVQQTREVFLEELSRRSTPGELHGIYRTIAKRLGVSFTNIRDRLVACGINASGEIQRKQFSFALKVKATMDQPPKQVREELEVSKSMLLRYRRKIKDGSYLVGAIETKGKDADLWWAIDNAGIVGKGRIDLGLRTETNLKDLDLFDRKMREARDRMLETHPDHNPGNKKAEERYKFFSEQRDKLTDARKKYIARENRFRKRFGLPLLAIS